MTLFKIILQCQFILNINSKKETLIKIIVKNIIEVIKKINILNSLQNNNFRNRLTKEIKYLNLSKIVKEKIRNYFLFKVKTKSIITIIRKSLRFKITIHRIFNTFRHQLQIILMIDISLHQGINYNLQMKI